MPAINPSSDSSSGPSSVGMSIGRATLGWSILFVVLVGMADFEVTADLAAAFAWLIFVAVLLLYGPAALQNISALTSSVSKFQKGYPPA